MPRSGMAVRAERVLRALTRGWWRGASPTAGLSPPPHPFPGGDLFSRAGHPGVAAASRGTTANLLINSQINPVVLWF